MSICVYFDIINKIRDIMKIVILAGGLGTPITEEIQFKPKPMIEIGGADKLIVADKDKDLESLKDYISNGCK